MTPQEFDTALDAQPTGIIYHTGYLAFDRYDPIAHVRAPKAKINEALAVNAIANYVWGKAERGEVLLVQRRLSRLSFAGRFEYIAIKAKGARRGDPRPA